MKNFLKSNWQILCIFLTSFIMFFRSLFVFYTNDDFFLLKISNANNIHDFINFFGIFKGPDGLGMYRPLTTQVFYFLAHRISNLNPLILHIVSFGVFFAVIYLVYKLTIELIKDKKVALISAFLYSVSASHFAHLYYLATFQELGMTLFVLLTCLMFLKKRYFLAFIFFVLSLMSKETAVVTPFLLGLIYLFQKYRKEKVIKFKKFLFYLLPYVTCLIVYLLIRVFSYGFATGDSYVWDFSIKRIFNTLGWYLLWSFNLPESLVDFIGPGFHLNPNLLKYWSSEMIPISILFIFQILVAVYAFIKSKFSLNTIYYLLFTVLWFVISLVPVLFLPIHKFTFYLTLPLVGVVILLSNTLRNSKLLIPFIVIWFGLSFLTLRFTVQTNWITQGQNISKRVLIFFEKNRINYQNKTITFVDTQKDTDLPWSPTATVKTALSDKNFFLVFYPELASSVSYLGAGEILIESRQFLGY